MPLLDFLVVVVVVAASGRWLMLARRRRLDHSMELAEVTQLAEEDIAAFGEQLMRMDGDAAGTDADEATRTDYETALDAYETAQRRASRLREPSEVNEIVGSLTAGRYALACVQARLEGRPVPAYRVPCFFNPQHGPSVRDVMWTPSGHGTRSVPACAQDAERVARGETPPDIRRVRVGGDVAPYWEAGTAYAPYGRQWYTAALAEGALTTFKLGAGGGGGGGS